MIMCLLDGEIATYKLEVNEETRKGICKTFSQANKELILDKEKIIFDGSYKPEAGEYLAINNFQLPDEIKDAIRNPLSVASYKEMEGTFPIIQAIFVGIRKEIKGAEQFTVAFQRFRKEQYISVRAFNLFFDSKTFLQEKRFGISISDSIDCAYIEGELQFVSYYFARQVFDLSEYYRSATDQEVKNFAASQQLKIDDSENFENMADSWIRRKIALINDSRVLEKYKANEIKSLAKAVDISIEVKNKKIVFPSDKKEVKIILGFLDEEAYKGPFSQNTYLANSKRTIANA